MEFNTETILVIGFIACFLPLVFAYRLYGISRLGNAIAYMFISEAWGILITISFGVLAYLGFLSDVPDKIQWSMRLMFFVPALATSLHLKKVCREVRFKEFE